MTRYLVIQDLDEFVVPMRSKDWQSMVNDMNARLNSERVASYNFRNRFFPIVGNLTPPGPRETRVVRTLATVRADRQLSPYTVRSKVMARPERVVVWHVHLILATSLVRRDDVNARVDTHVGQLFHYRREMSVAKTEVVARMKDFEEAIRRRLNVATAAICLTGDYAFPS